MNRRLGLSDDSTVGKSVAAAASVGAKIPLTEIGAQARAEGRQVDQQTPAERLRLRPQGGRKRAAHGSERPDQGLPFLRGLSVGARQPHDIHRRLRLVVP
ncbi:MAG: hypothetical protein MZU91_12905 [Desulfosudis oleivorans]|nr:hypothetical protein [Desulfosudis oleivorans]